MDKRSDRGEFYPGGDRASAPAPGGDTEKVDRVNVGEIGKEYTLKTVKEKVDQIVRVIAPAATSIALMLGLPAYAATAPLEDIPNTAHVVTNEEDTVALDALRTATNALAQSQMSQLSLMSQAASNNTANALQTALGALAAESNRVETTYAKRGEIPTAPDLAPYALKSELPTDYLKEGDITNFATRAWISAQGYATEAGTGARLDAQDLAIGAATNEQNAAIAATSNALATAHAADMAKVGAATNALKAAMSELSSDTMNRFNALEITGGNTRLWTSDARMFQDATGVVWQVQVVTGNWSVVHSWTTNGVDFGWTGPYWWGPAEGVDNDYYEGPGWYIDSGNLTPWRRSEDQYAAQIVVEWEYYGEEAHAVTTTCSRTVQWVTNAVKRVVYKNELAAATNAVLQGASEQTQVRIQMLEEMGTVMGATRIMPVGSEGGVTASNVWQIASEGTNYTDNATNGVMGLARSEFIPISGDGVITSVEMFLNAELHEQGMLRIELPDGISASPQEFLSTAQITNMGAVASSRTYTDEATNALAQTIRQGGGTPEWREVNYDVEVDMVNYVTNGIAILTFINAGYAYGINVSTNGWPEGASMFVRGSFRAGATYTIPNDLRLIGYGTWPTNNFQSVWWRSGTNVYVNVILEE